MLIDARDTNTLPDRALLADDGEQPGLRLRHTRPRQAAHHLKFFIDETTPRAAAGGVQRGGPRLHRAAGGGTGLHCVGRAAICGGCLGGRGFRAAGGDPGAARRQPARHPPDPPHAGGTGGGVRRRRLPPPSLRRRWTTPRRRRRSSGTTTGARASAPTSMRASRGCTASPATTCATSLTRTTWKDPTSPARRFGC
jgi:hypothetical protein